MTRTSDINNRIQRHMVLSDIEISTNGFMLPFDNIMHWNLSKFKRLGKRKIKYVISDNPDCPFLIDVTYYNRVNDASYINIRNIRINLTFETTTDIGSKIISILNQYSESKGKSHGCSSYTRYHNAVGIRWDNASGSDDYFEFRLCNEYTFDHFKFEGGTDSPNLIQESLTRIIIIFIYFLTVVLMVYMIVINH
jgi:hypothetical protein